MDGEEQTYVNYSVGDRDFQAGPYSADEAEFHLLDIAGYAGVHTVYLCDRRDEERLLMPTRPAPTS